MPSIFIVASDSKLLLSLENLFLRAEFDVSAFSQPSEMLRDSNDREPQCVLAQTQNTKVATLQLIRNIRAIFPHIPVIVIGTEGELSAAVEALHAGAVDYFQAPVVDRILLESVQNAISSE